ncbi:serine hydrolase domain-containing protein [Micromonospora echinofusca]|uniref:serine hydrolase domain-containing protein n=1 Tax=Micromonospora echinofusca TaxID=47858 RepID=UPI001AD7D5E7|nr:serine hydrolase domain-containing protein [Micromonospora echinofusca]
MSDATRVTLPTTHRSPYPELARLLDAVIDDAVGEQRVVGTAVLVAHRGEVVYSRHAGWADREAGVPVAPGHVFRLASMTKPVVSAAALALVDRGALTLDTPVHEVLPYFRPRLADGSEPTITLRQLLAHTSGLSYGFLSPDNEPYRSAGVSDGGDASGITLTENLRRLAGVPLMFAPDSEWGYSLGTDVAGAMVEAVTGEPLADAVARLVTGPLGMTDTAFVATDPARLTAAYADPDRPGRPARRMAATDQVPMPFGGPIHYAPARATDPTAFPSGGMGMVGTAPDYLAFLEAVRTGGAPVLSPASAEAISTDAVPGHTVHVGPGMGFGLGFAVVRDQQDAGSVRPTGSYGWGGVYGTNAFVDPHADLSVVALTNTALEGLFGAYVTEVETAVYRGLDG